MVEATRLLFVAGYVALTNKHVITATVLPAMHSITGVFCIEVSPATRLISCKPASCDIARWYDDDH